MRECDNPLDMFLESLTDIVETPIDPIENIKKATPKPYIAKPYIPEPRPFCKKCFKEMAQFIGNSMPRRWYCNTCQTFSEYYFK